MEEKLSLSVCLITFNEALFIRSALQSIERIAREIIIVDSFSTDETLQTAKDTLQNFAQLKIYERSWTDHFSEARNFALSKASESWILFIDGDEVLENDAQKKIKKLTQSNTNAFSLIQRNYTPDGSIEGSLKAENIPPCFNAKPGSSLYYFDNWMERLFKNGLGIEYQGRIHETIIPKCLELGIACQRTDMILHHGGRLKPHLEKKLDYYYRLSEKKVADAPSDPIARIEWLTILSELGKNDQAWSEALKAYPLAKFSDALLLTCFQIALRKSEFSIAEKWIQDYLKKNPSDIYALSQLSTALLYQRKDSEFVSLTQSVLQKDPEQFVIHINLAVYYFEISHFSKARDHLLIAQRIRPNDSFIQDSLIKIDAELQNH